MNRPVVLCVLVVAIVGTGLYKYSHYQPGARPAAVRQPLPESEIIGGNIAPNPIINHQTIFREQLTDVAALDRAAGAAVKAAPPLDYNDPASRARRDAFIALSNKAAGTARYLVELQCGAAADSAIPLLTFNAEDRNLYLTLYSVDEHRAKTTVDAAYDLSINVEKQFGNLALLALSSGGDETLSPPDFISTHEALYHDEIQLGLTAEHITISGVRIDILNSPFAGLGYASATHYAEAALELAEYQLAVTRGERPAIYGWTDPLKRETAAWFLFPRGLAGDGMWSARVPFAGQIDSTCLVGNFDGLASGEFGLSGSLTHWYITDRKTGRILFKTDRENWAEKYDPSKLGK